MRHPLPYAFARTHQLLLEDDGRTLTLWHLPEPPAGAWSEVLRMHVIDHFQQLDAQSLAQRISASYAGADIHIEPYERHSSVRFRIDGTLREVVQPNRALHAALISRLKIMADLDIAEKRLPQDGRISLRLGQRAIDVRVSTLPGAHGERAVLRLLDKSQSRLTLASVGMQGATLQRFEQLITQPHGIVLVTGPTGSGKTTTLYAALQQLDAAHFNIM
ncbi:MAG: type II secretion system protein GspE, partial [Betaproteobacteria bacterium]|nr:type II secretion system protein GspE [Betaproteobacteria bacterium]